ncbi:uncharacterized protein LOC113235417 [Hyposmocoma kahamanoa]|uniref:uncharacterized protein LOC113235417 n=1 Tax=Hyposmocoma kahamanoa TaxID=1477025 RepID=UPI000E6D73D1|nr:uncharacterized protein LOC113235417 [Hyposmocoma kahamanoa]
MVMGLSSKVYNFYLSTVPVRNVQLSVIGAASDIGSKLALLLKKNDKITKLNIYDYDSKIHGLAIELNQIPGGPTVSSYDGEKDLPAAITQSNLILMVARTHPTKGVTSSTMLQANAPAVQKLCKAISENNPDAFLAISTNPINSMMPFASAMLYRYNCYNPFKIFGITHIDTARARSYAGKTLQANPRHLQIPVIGGHSEQTVVPLFSNLTPDFYTLDIDQADLLTRLVKKADTEVLNLKGGNESAVVSVAWSVYEFAEGLVDALWGHEAEVHSFTANPHFGTRFFGGPTIVGPHGIVRTCSNFQMSNLECGLLSDAVSVINKDVALGEDLCGAYY